MKGGNGFKRLLVGLIFLAILCILVTFSGFAPKVFAATSNQTNVTVQVGSSTQITVMPTQIVWTSVNPGTVGGMQDLTIKNSGSNNITTVFGYADTISSEPSNPISIGSASAFSSGGVLMFRRNTTNAPYYYVDRLEWNITQPTGTGSTSCTNPAAWGYYRNATVGASDYLWCLMNGTKINATAGCNSTGTQLFISSAGDNGTTASRDPTISGGVVSSQNNWGIFSGYTSGPLSGHCVAASMDCTKILIYEYDKRTTPNFAACTLSSNLRDTKLVPGDMFSIKLDAWVPQGMPAGWLASSWLTIEAGP